MSQHTPGHAYWVFVTGEDTPRNTTPFSRASAYWYADTLAIELGVLVRVFRHARTTTLGRLIYEAHPQRAAYQVALDARALLAKVEGVSL